jgi:hypothetical protein
MKRRQTHRGRFYDEVTGEAYPSVTTIIGGAVAKPALIGWAATTEREMVTDCAGSLYAELMKEIGPDGGYVEYSKLAFITKLQERLGKQKAHQKALEKAGDIGGQAHRFIEWKLRTELLQDVGPSPEIGPEAAIAVNAWQEWRETVNLKPLAVESQVVSKTYGYAGTTDYLCAEVNGIETLVDWKTSKAIFPEMFLQAAAYWSAVREMQVGNPQQALIVRLPKTVEQPGFEVVPVEDLPGKFQTFLHVFELWKYLQAEDKYLKHKDAEVERGKSHEKEEMEAGRI